MSYVEIYKIQNDGSQKTVCTCSLTSDQVAMDGEKNLIENLRLIGIYDYTDPSNRAKLFPSDGLKFLEQLKFNFKSGYLNASGIKESK